MWAGLLGTPSPAGPSVDDDGCAAGGAGITVKYLGPVGSPDGGGPVIGVPATRPETAAKPSRTTAIAGSAHVMAATPHTRSTSPRREVVSTAACARRVLVALFVVQSRMAVHLAGGEGCAARSVSGCQVETAQITTALSAMIVIAHIG